MLQRLHIQNYAIIDDLEIDFGNHLNIITGETGAGKSILVGALGLILGNRADTGVLMDKERKCFVEASFLVKDDDNIHSFLRENDLEGDNEILVRREISSSGKSRAFVNDTPVVLTQLKQLSSILVDLHLQFDSLELGNDEFQFEVLDALAGNKEFLKQYKSFFSEFESNRKELERLKQLQSDSNKELDYFRFLLDELEEANWKENELEDLDSELKLLSHAEQIKSGLQKINFDLKDNEESILRQLKSIAHHLASFANYHSGINAISERIQSSQIELQDIASELEAIEEEIQHDPTRIDLVNERISLGYKQLQKHGAKTTGELLIIKKELEEKLDRVIHLDETIASLETKMSLSRENMLKQSSVLTQKRTRQIKPFEENVNRLLVQVGMPNARLKVELTATSPNILGADKIEFLFDANKSSRFEPISKVASGGELSRLMLIIKSLVARSIHLPTLIFDEIDTGISGEAAKQVGIIMKELGQSHQVISITHQPQIAARADAHFYVYKKESLGRVRTHIRRLADAERVETIAKMLGGEKPGVAAIENARELLEG
ncbi:MAG: DNA repair protein RecN [Bacteroidetes bacterium]|nr:MAG: DNA repair protein RecN [Bacteroidota bacterium]